jgi:integrase
MITRLKRKFVNDRHKNKVWQMTGASGYKKDKWKTFVRTNGKRKEILKNSEEEIYDALYEFYKALEEQPKTFREVAESYIQYKKDCLNRTTATIRLDKQLLGYISDMVGNEPIADVCDEDIKRWLVKDFMPTSPTESRLKKELQFIGQVFEYAIKKRLCYENPIRFISAKDYLCKCKQSWKTDEEKEFSLNELKRIREASEKQFSNPRAQMRMFSMETGLRAGELCALHKDDVSDGFIHVHRQQVKDWDDEGHQCFYEVPYTKEEKRHPHGGRYVPLTEEAKKLVERILSANTCESEYLFNQKGKMITKESYQQNLRKFCRGIGLETTNNHAFRMAFNSRLIELEFSSSDRALVLGHQVQTNEAHYSLTDKRRLESIKERLA